jgi:CubicO group peptidase (beta-lactamase class C family)
MEPPVHSPVLDEIANRFVLLRGVAPAACVALAVRSAGRWRLVAGSAGTRSVQDRRAVDPGLVFDLASLTKPFVALTAARLAARGALTLHAPVGTWVPESAGAVTGEVALELLLAHRAGLQAHRELFAPLRQQRSFCRRSALLEAARARRPQCTGPTPDGGWTPLYSDLGYLLVGEALSRATGRPLDELVEREVCLPLGVEAGSARQWLARQPGFATRVAPTEIVPWRGGELVAVVHDENAWAMAGHGLAGHAGLFADAANLARLGAAVVDAASGRLDDWLSTEGLRPLLRQRPGGSLRAGFDGKSGPASAAGRASGPRTFGHLGFTGTSLWCDPDAGVVTVLLSNRVNPTREHQGIQGARPRVHDALYAAAHRLGETDITASGMGFV